MIAMVLIPIGLLLYPTVRSIVSSTDMSAWLPLTQAAVTLLPYAFLFFIIYALIRQAKS